MIRPTGLAIWLVAVATPVAAIANSLQGTQMMGKWVGSDKCAAAAQRAFPDYTAESNAKRDAQFKQCLAGSNLPPRGAAETAPARP